MQTELEPRYRIDRLYELLPTVIRRSDSEQGEPLRALLQVITKQANLLEDDLLQLYDNWFIETCVPWVIPYIADLIGHQPIHEAGEPGYGPKALVRNAVLLPRREVANTLRYHSRKGTLMLLEQLARDVAGWPALAVEFTRLLAQTQSLRLPHLARGRNIDLRDADLLNRLGSGFDGLAHATDLRRPISIYSAGRHAPSSVGVLVWRLMAYSVTRAPAAWATTRRFSTGPASTAWAAGRSRCWTFPRRSTAGLSLRPGSPVIDLPARRPTTTAWQRLPTARPWRKALRSGRRVGPTQRPTTVSRFPLLG